MVRPVKPAQVPTALPRRSSSKDAPMIASELGTRSAPDPPHGPRCDKLSETRPASCSSAAFAAAMYTEDGDVLTSVYFEPEWGSGMLCAETGAICEAEKRGKRVTASVCVSRLSGEEPILILTP